MNGADLLCETLLANDVDVCFANPGTSEMHFVAALDRRPRMRCVLGLAEGVVSGAADGYARMAGKPAATLLHLGPGLANALANLHNARRAFTPIINIVGDHATYHRANDAPLTSDIVSLASPMSQWVGEAATPDSVNERVNSAYNAAVSAPGVATLVLPADAAWGEVSDHERPVPRAVVTPPPPVSAEHVAEAAKALRSKKRVALLLSGEALRARSLVIAGGITASSGARLLAPTSNSRMERGSGRIPITKIPYPVDQALKELADIDVLILIGTKEPVAFFAYPNKPVRLLPETCEVINLAVIGQDLHGALNALAGELGAGPATSGSITPPVVSAPEISGALTGDAVCGIVARMLPDNAIVCDESVTSGRRFFDFSFDAAPHDYLQLTGGAIGIGIPMATGAAIACPGRKVISLQADGSGMYTNQGLWTQAREQLDVVTIIFANRSYAILKGEMQNVGVNALGANADRLLNLDNPAIDWVLLARAMGVDASRATTCDEFAKALQRAMSISGPVLIEAVI
jgi:acetolactate synthase-1/2/3 large subunit